MQIVRINKNIFNAKKQQQKNRNCSDKNKNKNSEIAG